MGYLRPLSTSISWRGARPGLGAPLVGGAVGLNVIIVFDLPTQVIAGGAAFLCAWMVALLFIALPLIWLEQGLGTCFQSGIAGCFHRSRRRWEWLGWWGALIGLTLIIATLIGAAHMGHMIVSSSHDDFSSPMTGLFAALGITAMLICGLWLGAYQRRIDAAVLLIIPLTAFVLLCITIIGFLGPGGGIAFATMTTMRWSLLWSPGLWLNAVALAVATGLLGCGFVAHLSSLHPRRDDTASAGAMVLIGAAILQILLMMSVAVIVAEAASSSGVMPTNAHYTFTSPWLFITGISGFLPSLLGFALVGPLLITIALAMQQPMIAATEILGLRSFTARRTLAAMVLGPTLVLLFWGDGVVIDGVLAFGLLPATILLALVSHYALGLNGIRGHLDAHAAMRPGRGWQTIIETILPYLILLACCQRILQIGRDHDVFTMIAALIGLAVLPLGIACAIPRAARRQRALP